MDRSVVIGIWDSEHEAYRYEHSLPEVKTRDDEFPVPGSLVYVSMVGAESGVYEVSRFGTLTMVDTPYVVCERGGEVDMPTGTVVYISGFPGRKDGTYVVVEGSRYVDGVVNKVLVPREVLKE